MNWSNNIDISTFNNAYETYKKHFKNKYSKTLSFMNFYKQTLTAKYKYYTIKELKNMDIKNLNYDRLKKDINETYKDEPRGKDDIKSIKYSINNIVSPICIMKINSQYILLDGMHRIVASNILDSKVCVCLISVK